MYSCVEAEMSLDTRKHAGGKRGNTVQSGAARDIGDEDGRLRDEGGREGQLCMGTLGYLKHFGLNNFTCRAPELPHIETTASRVRTARRPAMNNTTTAARATRPKGRRCTRHATEGNEEDACFLRGISERPRARSKHARCDIAQLLLSRHAAVGTALRTSDFERSSMLKTAVATERLMQSETFWCEKDTNDVNNMKIARQDQSNTEKMTQIPQFIPELHEEDAAAKCESGDCVINTCHITATALSAVLLLVKNVTHNDEEVLNLVSKQRSSQSQVNRERLFPIVKIIIMLGRQNIPFRGHSDDSPVSAHDIVATTTQASLILRRVNFGDSNDLREDFITFIDTFGNLCEAANQPTEIQVDIFDFDRSLHRAGTEISLTGETLGAKVRSYKASYRTKHKLRYFMQRIGKFKFPVRLFIGVTYTARLLKYLRDRATLCDNQTPESHSGRPSFDSQSGRRNEMVGGNLRSPRKPADQRQKRGPSLEHGDRLRAASEISLEPIPTLQSGNPDFGFPRCSEITPCDC
ncbi:hypothetical protein PR048_030231 [Dryococelus australis]|uniref:Uncharacterized protein n=1 Tax=Dryococelus australis TaxID=614101 RepID=A0ABQ9GB55_9NEOP|nr:hypothetical protein PR048_030231 [Dryococelus australis]